MSYIKVTKIKAKYVACLKPRDREDSSNKLSEVLIRAERNEGIG
jgi:hypothetical protein